jgi:uncharacterized protein YecA (UPF0149 family)
MKEPSDVRKINLRVPMDLKEETEARAEAMGVSFNAYCLMALRNFNAWTVRQTWAGADQPARAGAGGESPKRLAPAAAPPPAVAPTSRRVGRNEPCPCGSGRKAKVCHPEYC